MRTTIYKNIRIKRSSTWGNKSGSQTRAYIGIMKLIGQCIKTDGYVIVEDVGPAPDYFWDITLNYPE